MKKLVPILCSIAMFAVGRESQAAPDVLSDHKVAIAGTVTLPSSTSTARPIVLAITVKNMLALFGVNNADPKQVGFFFDETAMSYVLATLDRQTIYGTVLAYSTSDGAAFPLSGKPYNAGGQSYYGGSAITMLNGALKGAATYGCFSVGANMTAPTSFNAYGTLAGGTVVLVQGRLLESGKIAP